jgi:hypothetical protein
MRKDKDNSMKNKVTDQPNMIPLKEIGACEGHLCVVLGSEVVKKNKIGD